MCFYVAHGISPSFVLTLHYVRAKLGGRKENGEEEGVGNGAEVKQPAPRPMLSVKEAPPEDGFEEHVAVEQFPFLFRHKVVAGIEMHYVRIEGREHHQSVKMHFIEHGLVFAQSIGLGIVPEFIFKMNAQEIFLSAKETCACIGLRTIDGKARPIVVGITTVAHYSISPFPVIAMGRHTSGESKQ